MGASSLNPAPFSLGAVGRTEAQGQQSGVRVLTTHVNFSKSFEPVVLKWGSFRHPRPPLDIVWGYLGLSQWGNGYYWQLEARDAVGQHDAQKGFHDARIIWARMSTVLRLSKELSPSQLPVLPLRMPFAGCEGVRRALCQLCTLWPQKRPTCPIKQVRKEKKEEEKNQIQDDATGSTRFPPTW